MVHAPFIHLAPGGTQDHLSQCWQEDQALDVLESIKEAFNPLLVFTDSLSGESYLTVSDLKPELHIIIAQILKNIWRSDSHDISWWKIYWPDNRCLCVGTLLDPQFKTQYINPDNTEATKNKWYRNILHWILGGWARRFHLSPPTRCVIGPWPLKCYG